MSNSPYNSISSYIRYTPGYDPRYFNIVSYTEQRQHYSPYGISYRNQYDQKNSYVSPESYCKYKIIYVPESVKVIKSYHIDDPFLKHTFNPNDINFDIYDDKYTYYQDQLRSAAQKTYKGVPLNVIAKRFRRWYDLGSGL